MKELTMEELAHKHLRLIKEDLLALGLKTSNKGKPSFQDMANNTKLLNKNLQSIILARKEGLGIEMKALSISQGHVDDMEAALQIFVSGLKSISVDVFRKF